MNDFTLGNHLYELRKKAGLSQAALGARVGVTNKAVSKWENGSAKPTLEMAKRLADALGVSLDALTTAEKPKKQISKIVVTGGPCAGKTTALSWIQNTFSKMGYTVLFVDETATELINGGAAPWMTESMQDFQTYLTQLQLDKEQAFADIAQTLKAEKVLIVCDRGTLDASAYISRAEFDYVLKKLNTNEVALRDQYDAVFHLVTTAKGAESFYTLSNNTARTESIEQAAQLDDRLIAVWTGHPHFRVLDNSTDFEEKMRRLMSEISLFLGEPTPMEIERKFLIEYPDTKALLARPNCQKVDIIQIYLTCDNDAEEMRIRQRGQDGHYIYFKTTKRKLGNGTRVEIEQRLSAEEYLELMPLADPACRPIVKQRYCLTENGTYYEIDIYPEWKKQAIMEIELRSIDQPITFPEGINVIREVTDDDAFSNHALARISTND